MSAETMNPFYQRASEALRNAAGRCAEAGEHELAARLRNDAETMAARICPIRYPISYRPQPGADRINGFASGPDMESALATFKRMHPETVSHCIYNPDHLENRP